MVDFDFDNYWNQEGAFEDAIDDVQDYYENRDDDNDTEDIDIGETTY